MASALVAVGLRVILPCLDEEPAIGGVVAGLRDRLDPASDRVIVVDNGSRDRTAAVAAAAGARVVSEPRRGYGRACRAGLELARDGIAVFMDGDGADDPEALPAILAPILEGRADLVVGARSEPDPGAMTSLQRFGNRLACRLITLSTGTRVTDLGPMRAISAGRLRGLEMESETYGWSTEMTVKALRAGYRYLEVPVRYRSRIGVSKVSGTVSGSVRAGASILWTALRYAKWRPRG